MRRRTIANICYLNAKVILCVIAFSPSTQGQFVAPDQDTISIEQSRQLDDFITQLALGSLPANFVEEKDWGKQSERWDGVKVRFENGRIRTKRRKKKVNHGTWNRYEANLIEPKKNFSIKIHNLREVSDQRVAFDVLAKAKIDLTARQSKWIKGVQLYSLSAEGSATVELTVAVTLASTMNMTKFPPDIIFDPKIDDAKIQLSDFRIDRVSKAGGEVAQQITRATKNQLDRKIASKEEKLVKKLNEKIEENRERLTLSVHDAMKSKWAPVAQQLASPEKPDE